MKRWNILGFGLWLALCGASPSLRADDKDPVGGVPAEYIAWMFRDADSGGQRSVSQIAVTSPLFHARDGNSTWSDSISLGISSLIERTFFPAMGQSREKCWAIPAHAPRVQPYTVGLDTLAE